MEFRVLGPVELWSGGEEYILGSLKAKSVLAVLLLNMGMVVPVEVLIDRVWDTHPPPKARENLSVYVTRLRRSLRRVPGGTAKLASRAHGYVLEDDRHAVDLYRFRQLRRQATMAANEGNDQRAASLLREADRLWQGEALAGLPGDAIARIRHSLAEERRAATLQRAELELALGQPADLVGEFQRLSEGHPADEEFVALYMRALYLSGRQSDALTVYRELRSRLVTEQGAEPGPTLVALHQQILRRELTLAAVPAAPPVTEPTVPDSLPPAASEFVGREHEIGLITADGSPPVALITGMPGIGKTSLAVAAAHAMQARYPGGRLLVSFHTHDPQNPPLDAAGALHRLLRMLGVPAEAMPLALPERARLWRAELARRRMIVILDDADPQQIQPLLAPAAGSRIMVTSRHRLSGLDGLGEAASVTLGALHTDDAVQLFTRIAGSAAANDPGSAAEAVRRCGGHPLAIRLVARRLRDGHSTTLAGLLPELARPASAFGHKHGTDGAVAAAFDLSYQALTAEFRRFFRRLGLHPGTDITIHAAAALADGSLRHTGAALTVLADRHLLERSGSAFKFHDVTRTYAAMRAAEDEPAEARRLATDRLIAYYRFTADHSSRLLYPGSCRDLSPLPRPPTAVPALSTPHSAEGWLEGEWRSGLATARHACQHERKRDCAALTLALAPWLEAAGHWGEAADAHALALQACRELQDLPGIARTSLELSLIANRTGNYPAALRQAKTAAATFDALGDRAGHADALNLMGIAHQCSARFRAALACHQEAAETYNAAADARGLATARNYSGIACAHLGRYSTAMGHFQAALALYRQEDDRSGEAKTRTNLARIYLNQGHHRDALDEYQHALAIYKEIHAGHHVTMTYQNIACVHYHKGDYHLALSLFSKALAAFRKAGNLPGELTVLNSLGEALIATEDHRESLTYYQRAGALSLDLGNSYERVIALRGIADAYRGLGEYGRAVDYYQEALRLAREISEPRQEGKVLDGLAETMLQAQDPGAARIYWRQARDLFEQLGVPEAETVRLRLAALATGHASPIPRPA